MRLLPIVASFLLCMAAPAGGADQTLVPRAPVPGERFGHALAMEGDLAVIASTEAVYAFREVGGRWAQEGVVARRDGGSPGAVSVALHGNRCLIGDSRPRPPGAGHARVLERTDAGWMEVALLRAGRASDTGFGSDVSLSNEYCAVGTRATLLGRGSADAAYVFRRIAGGWVQHARLSLDDPPPSTRFGEHVAIDGAWCAVSCVPFEDFTQRPHEARLFHLENGSWIERARLTPATGDARFAGFGAPLSLDGDRLLVGGFVLASAALPVRYDEGAVVFRRDGDVWAEEAWLPATVPVSVQVHESLAILGSVTTSIYALRGGAWRRQGVRWTQSFQAFGNAVSISSDWCLVGAPRDDSAGEDVGAVYAWSVPQLSERTQPAIPLPAPLEPDSIDSMSLDDCLERLSLLGKWLPLAQPSNDHGAALRREWDLLVSRVLTLRIASSEPLRAAEIRTLEHNQIMARLVVVGRLRSEARRQGAVPPWMAREWQLLIDREKQLQGR